MAAGYSGKSVAEKLGLKEGFRAIVLNSPQNYPEEIGELKFPLRFEVRLTGKFNFIHFFTASKAELKKKFPMLIKHLGPGGMIWISWPKRSSGIETDVTEDTLREIGLPLGVVDIKVIAFNEIWSGLKFVPRKK